MANIDASCSNTNPPLPHPLPDMPHYNHTVWTQRYLLLIVLLTATPGCTYERVVRDGWAQMRQLSNQSRPNDNHSGSSNPSHRNSTLWTIELQTFDNPNRRDHARNLITRLQNDAHLPDLWADHSLDHTRVYRGRYQDPHSPAATSDLRQTRMVRLDGQLRFAAARLVPLGDAAPLPTLDALDLKGRTGMYSLQIGFYDKTFGPEYQQAAAQAAQTLRQQGHQAFYYHGPHRSMVTVGLFTDDDFARNGAVWTYGQKIRSLQEQFPYNLANGRTIIEKVACKSIGEQPSSLVRVP